MKTKLAWRIIPAMSSGKKSFGLETITTYDNGTQTCSTFGYFSTLKAAKAMAAHMKRKPINV